MYTYLNVLILILQYICMWWQKTRHQEHRTKPNKYWNILCITKIEWMQRKTRANTEKCPKRHKDVSFACKKRRKMLVEKHEIQQRIYCLYPLKIHDVKSVCIKYMCVLYFLCFFFFIFNMSYINIQEHVDKHKHTKSVRAMEALLLFMIRFSFLFSFWINGFGFCISRNRWQWVNIYDQNSYGDSIHCWTTHTDQSCFFFFCSRKKEKKLFMVCINTLHLWLVYFEYCVFHIVFFFCSHFKEIIAWRSAFTFSSILAILLFSDIVLIQFINHI